MSHDAEYAQKSFLTGKQSRWESEGLRQEINRLASSVRELERTVQNLRRDLAEIKGTGAADA